MAAMALCAVAGILILAILGGSEDVASKAFSFAFVLALFTLPAAAGAYLAWVRPGLLWLGALTAVAALAAFVAVIAAVWHGNIFEGGGGDWKTAGVLTLISIGTGQAALILSLDLVFVRQTPARSEALLQRIHSACAEEIERHGVRLEPHIQEA